MNSMPFFSLVAAATLFGVSTRELPAAESAIFEQVCANCHGKKGQGNAEIKAPSIAAQPEWYTLSQLGKYQAQMRGGNPEDTTGQLMHGVAGGLNEDAKKEVAAYIKELRLVPTVNTMGGDARKGKTLFEDNCMECHRYNGKGELAFKSAQLIGYQDWYLFSQLKKFAAGHRGKHPEDEEGAKMVHRVSFLSGEEDYRNIVAFIAELAKKYGND